MNAIREAEAATPTAGPPSRLVRFVAGEQGPWQIERVEVIKGDGIEPAARLMVSSNESEQAAACAWSLRGLTSNERYAERHEKTALQRHQEGLGRRQATCAALIPIRKSPNWWALAQDERRAIFEPQSQHIGIGMRYLPAIARRLYHCRDLSVAEPFDFLTWFEYAPSDTATFERLLAELRASREWDFVDREVDIRLSQVVLAS